MYSESTEKWFCVPCQLFMEHQQEKEAVRWNLCLTQIMYTYYEYKFKSLWKSQFTAFQSEEETKYWHSNLKRVVATIQALPAAGLPLRGHKEYFGCSQKQIVGTSYCALRSLPSLIFSCLSSSWQKRLQIKESRKVLLHHCWFQSWHYSHWWAGSNH